MLPFDKTSKISSILEHGTFAIFYKECEKNIRFDLASRPFSPFSSFSLLLYIRLLVRARFWRSAANPAEPPAKSLYRCSSFRAALDASWSISGSGSGSGSGSSGCASSTLGTLPLNRCYSSLPRGALAAYGSLTRPATLPRLPLGLGLGPAPGTGNGPLPQNDKDRDSNSSSKRNSDSVLCHRLPLLHPLPTCDVTAHQGTGFHEIFNAIRWVSRANRDSFTFITFRSLHDDTSEEGEIVILVSDIGVYESIK